MIRTQDDEGRVTIEQEPGEPDPEPEGAEMCGCGTTVDVRWETDPYSEEIHGKSYWSWTCPVCLNESAMDI